MLRNIVVYITLLAFQAAGQLTFEYNGVEQLSITKGTIVSTLPVVTDVLNPDVTGSLQMTNPEGILVTNFNPDQSLSFTGHHVDEVTLQENGLGFIDKAVTEDDNSNNEIIQISPAGDIENKIVELSGSLYYGSDLIEDYYYEGISKFTDRTMNISSPGGNVEGKQIEGWDHPDRQCRFFLKDHLGSTRDVIDESGALTESYNYLAYGKMQTLHFNISEKSKQRFTGKEFDSEGGEDEEGGIGLFYFGARYYDSEIGLWTSTDPEEEYYNLYSYCGNDPINYFDMEGESTTKAIGFILKNFKELGKPLYTMKQAQSAVKSGHDVQMASSGLRNQLGRSLSNGDKPMKHRDGHLLKDGSRGGNHSHGKGHPEGWGHIFSGVLSFLLNRTDPEFLAVRKGVLEMYGDFKINIENGQEVWTVGKDGNKINPADLSIGKGGTLVQKITPEVN